MTRKTHAAIIALALFLGLGSGGVFGQSVVGASDSENTGSPWVAHIDVEKLRNSPLAEFLEKSLSVNGVLELQKILKESLGLDQETIANATFQAVGKDFQDTAILLHGKFETIDLDAASFIKKSSGEDLVSIYEKVLPDGPSLFIARHSPVEIVAGTSLEAVEISLASLAGKQKIRETSGLPPHAETEISSAIVSLSLDMRRIGEELDFEAKFTQSLLRMWLLAGTHGKEVELTVLIESNDAEGLRFLREQLSLATMMLGSQEDSPPELSGLVQALRVETKDGWMTVKISAPPALADRLLDSLTPLFQEETKPAPEPAEPAAEE